MGRAREKKEEARDKLRISISDIDQLGRVDSSQRSELKPQTFEEYCSQREHSLEHWWDRYTSLMSIARPAEPVALDARATAELERLRRNGNDDADADDYAKRLVGYYDNQLGRAFGSLEFIDMRLIPKSLVEAIKKAKIVWD